MDAREQPQPAAVLLLATSASIRTTTRSCTSSATRPCGRAPTAARSSRRLPPAAFTRTTTPCGSTRSDSRHMLIGCDGGFYVTYDSGATWDHLNILALGQFYHVAVDNKTAVQRLRRAAGQRQLGRAERTRSAAPARSTTTGCISTAATVSSAAWTPTIPTSSTPRARAARSAGGTCGPANAGRVRAATPSKQGEEAAVQLEHARSSSRATTRGIFYCGAQYVFRSIKRGATSKPISPELTAHQEGDDHGPRRKPAEPGRAVGRHRRRERVGHPRRRREVGQRARQAEGRRAARPALGREPRAEQDGRRPVLRRLDAHRSDDDKPYLYVTEDFGQTWKPIMANLPAFGSTRVLREDITNPNMLYCGTEFGIWVSVNRGQSWAKINNNLPTVAGSRGRAADDRERDRGRDPRPQHLGPGRGQPPADAGAHRAGGQEQEVRPAEGRR